jgi:hypothetical protein
VDKISKIQKVRINFILINVVLIIIAIIFLCVLTWVESTILFVFKALLDFMIILLLGKEVKEAIFGVKIADWSFGMIFNKNKK